MEVAETTAVTNLYLNCIYMLVLMGKVGSIYQVLAVPARIHIQASGVLL
jgi:hypothetical protein